jgi:hypothetical protein
LIVHRLAVPAQLGTIEIELAVAEPVGARAARGRPAQLRTYARSSRMLNGFVT